LRGINTPKNEPAVTMQGRISNELQLWKSNVKQVGLRRTHEANSNYYDYCIVGNFGLEC